MKQFAIILFSVLTISACDFNININKTPENAENLDSVTPSEESTFDRELIYGTWKIINAKYSEDANLTAWEHEDTYATFKENGLYKGEGYWGNGEGTYSISGNTITAYISNEPYVKYEVLTITESGDEEDLDIIAEIKITIVSSAQNVWVTCYKVSELDLTPEVSYPEEDIVNTESSTIMLISAIYGKVRDFSLYQHYIEYLALTNQREQLNTNSSLIYNAWASAYSAIASMNPIIEKLENRGETWSPKYAAQAKILRAYLYYNLTVLWGDVPYRLATSDNLYLPRTKAQEILTNEIATILKVMDDVEEITNESLSFSQDSYNMLLAEMHLCLGEYDKAISILNYIYNPLWKLSLIDITSPDGNFTTYGKEIWGENAESITIYDSSLQSLYKAECNKEITDISSSWNRSQYGKWAMLKRLGKAQELTGCEDYELLMPIPDQEIRTNPNVSQNDGYN